ncbi:DUF6042 family protein [Actinokineospora sp. G85]|uniref:DUF6042 family protein n=1 Tax=Actinokineospora sp. G85 TaxID=3406626 RepID=UPI003C759583
MDERKADDFVVERLAALVVGPWGSFLPPGVSDILGVFCLAEQPTREQIVHGVHERSPDWGQVELFTAEDYQELLSTSAIDAAAGLSLEQVNEQTLIDHDQRTNRVARYARQLDLPPPDTVAKSLDYLVRAGLLHRVGSGPEARYWPTPNPPRPDVVFELTDREQESLRVDAAHHHWRLASAIIELAAADAKSHGTPATVDRLSQRLGTDPHSTRAALHVLRLDPDVALSEDPDALGAADPFEIKYLRD